MYDEKDKPETLFGNSEAPEEPVRDQRVRQKASAECPAKIESSTYRRFSCFNLHYATVP